MGNELNRGVRHFCEKGISIFAPGAQRVESETLTSETAVGRAEGEQTIPSSRLTHEESTHAALTQAKLPFVGSCRGCEKGKSRMEKQTQSQPKDLTTSERLATTGRAVGQGIAHELRGEHETEKGMHQQVDEASVEQIIAEWPSAQKNVAQQMLAKYGLPNEVTQTQLFWYRNRPWKRTILSRDEASV